ncbi:hypothetical protein O7600_23320 [Micromonospora sp. WMMA1998]|uniref:hypothetical protein n=1 Tax=Micromonospora sp. WMMA1998 TaxID=3015167 RepID=UPI00248C30F1|nr:hypothetical protein [Micromonospora sp. WMMA1998]WBC14016.1 hypothetical protein O7600_23320 [Micromonospora sp. WMMA1998]
MSEARSFQALDDRLAGKPLDSTLYDGVPKWLEQPLRNWLGDCLDVGTSKRVMLRLRMVHNPRLYKAPAHQLIRDPSGRELLSVIDATLQLHSMWAEVDEPGWGSDERIDRFADKLVDLQQTLTDGASRYRLDFEGRCLVRRVDETAQQAADTAIASTTKTAADHLREAWVAAYGLNPEPDKVFNEAIRAVEEVACPLVQEKKAEAGSATLGTVIGELGKNAPHKWELVLPGKDGQPSGVEPIVSMMQTLWEAQLSRHGGAPKSRRQNQDEAEAAVHLAVLLVQWLSTGVLRRKA